MSAAKQNKSVELSLIAKADRRKNAWKKNRKFGEESSDSGNKKCEAVIQRDEQSDENKVAVRTALENYVILKEIFSHLSPPDLKSCCEVNEIWRSVADPMIVCHDVGWFPDDLMVVEITRGHTNPQVETKTWRAEMMGEMIRLLEETGDRRLHMRLTVQNIYQVEKQRAFEFFRTFGHRVFALTYKPRWSWDCRVGVIWLEDIEDLLKTLTECFPNLEELFLVELGLGKMKIGKPPGFPSLTYLRKVDFGFESNLSQKAMVEILGVMPNVEEIDNFPVTMLKILQDANKLHTLRSVQFCSTHGTNNDSTGMQTLVDMGIGLRSLVVEAASLKLDWSDPMRIQRNKARFESLLELGKDSLEHLILPPLEQIGFLSFPPKMTALKHISFRGKLSMAGIRENLKYFPDDFDFLGTFPNLNKVSVYDEESAKLLNHSFPKKTFGVEKLGDAVKILQVPSKLDEDVVVNLKKLFPRVERVERVQFDLES